jgi:hypothetical protein
VPPSYHSLLSPLRNPSHSPFTKGRRTIVQEVLSPFEKEGLKGDFQRLILQLYPQHPNEGVRPSWEGRGGAAPSQIKNPLSNQIICSPDAMSLIGEGARG